jgi:hypothetical protein
VGELDDATWQALGLTLTILGTAASVLLWRRRGAATGLRGLGWSLLPLAAALTGTLSLLWRIGEEIASWAVRLVFSPVVWVGVLLAGLSVVLLVVSGALRRRGSGRPASRQDPLPPGRTGPGRPAVSGDDDVADIEALLKKHGIA